MKNLFKITHLISALTMFFTLIAISHKTFAYVHYNEVEIDTSSGAVSFFDMKTLNEIIAESENFPLETLAQKIDDFFSSAPLSVDGRGGFYMMGPNDAYNIRNIPEEHRQRNPVYKIPSQVTIAFAQAYALFISKNLVHFTKALEAAVEFNLTVDQAKVSYNYFYTCLRSVALFAGPNSIDCAPDALKRIGFQRPAEALHLANLYIKLYRASRFAFRALAVKLHAV